MVQESHLPFLAPRANRGLFRTAVAIKPTLLSDVFHQLRHDLKLDVHEGRYGARVGTGDGSDSWELICLSDELFVILADCHYRTERSEWVLSESFIELHFTLVGSAIASWPMTQDAPSGALDLFLCHLGSQARYRITCSPGQRRSIAIYARPAAFARYLEPNSPHSQLILANLNKVGPRDAYCSRIPIDAPQIALVNQLLTIPYTDRRRYVYAAAKVDELLCSTIETCAKQDNTPTASVTLGPRDLHRLELARSQLLTDLSVTYTIPDLAAEVGINTAKLKAGFRMVFGCTVHECVLRARMARALELLSRYESVSNVALAVGYQHASSFSAAFTRHFGYNPSQVKTQAPGYTQSSTPVMTT